MAKFMHFKEWFAINRGAIVFIAKFLPKKWRTILLTIVSTFDAFYKERTVLRELSSEERPPIIPIIVIDPTGNPVPLPPQKPPVS